MFDEDISVFFDLGTHADSFIRQRPAQPDVSFAAIKGVVSKEALQGYAVGNFHELRYATGSVDLQDGDEVLHVRPAGSLAYRVRGEPELQNDGSESLVRLAEVRP